MQISTPQSAAIAYAVALLVAAALNYKSITPPVPITRSASDPEDTAFTGTGGFGGGVNGLVVFRALQTLLFIYHAAVACFFDTPTVNYLCPNPHRLDAALFTWSSFSTVCLSITIVCWSFRLQAFQALGASFTFTITAPKNGLVTTGLYGYVQHPSYTAFVMASVGQILLSWRVEGTPACWISPAQWMKQSQWAVIVALVLCQLYGMRLRVRDEEKFLKRHFGREWEVWHRRTARFLPGLF